MSHKTKILALVHLIEECYEHELWPDIHLERAK
jgi:hypothetical protein